MPSSYVDSVAPIIKAIVEVDPKSVVDIGPGWSKYGLMCREYLQNLQRIDAVEVEEGHCRDPKLTQVQDTVYDQVHISDARRLTAAFWKGYDLALLIDVIEHMSVPEGQQLLRAITSAGGKVLVSTPKVFIEQHDELNPHETHESLWTWREFRGFHTVQDVSTIDSLIFVVGRR